MPTILILVFAATFGFDLPPRGDDFASRTAIGAYHLADMPVATWFSSWSKVHKYADAGYSYFIASQGVFGDTDTMANVIIFAKVFW